ncbi:hypothetical protein AB9F26_20815 [Falsihalocynthiibacter sp. BN13B15]|uniref:hypothetical protein n=1 Tax=Falsihalocynthiibacter sp. BN13B15 TaxID=3240871 RepID=UPI00350FC311
MREQFIHAIDVVPTIFEGSGISAPDFVYDPNLGRPVGGIWGLPSQTQDLKKTLPMILQWNEAFDICSDALTGLNDAEYEPLFKLTAKADKLTDKADRRDANCQRQQVKSRSSANFATV